MDDPERAAWTIPSDRAKNGRAHYVPLSGLARETLLSAMELVDEEERTIFPSRWKGGTPITAHALAVAMRRFADQMKPSSPAAKTWRTEPPSPHDLRRTFATRLSSLGVSKEDRDALLNHIRADVGSKHYDLYERAKEKRVALNQWAETLRTIISPTSADTA
jgi:integrase